jgi:UDPglucose 6-dehydrogenase
MMKITVVALGYVGLTNAVNLASKGNQVIAYDHDEKKIAALQKGDVVLEEPGLASALAKAGKRLTFTSDEKTAYQDASIIFLAVDTPEGTDGSSDLTHLAEAVASIKKYATKDTFVIIRSTVPVGTANEISRTMNENSKVKFSIISNPEFLAEGQALANENFPYRIVVGAKGLPSFDLMRKIYAKPILNGVPYYEMSNASAEFTKYASNLFLAVKISYINELSRLAEPLGADITLVAQAMGADPRIGHSMLKAGVGYGGSCLPKDGSALAASAKAHGLRLSIAEDANEVNLTQPFYFYQKIMRKIGPVKGKKIAVLGLSYKAGTGDIRSSVAKYFVPALTKDGALVAAYEPSKNARKAFGVFADGLDGFTLVDTLEGALKDAEAILILTEDESFAALDETKLLSLMPGRVIFDGRNLYQPDHFRYFDYVSVGRPEHLRKL